MEGVEFIGRKPVKVRKKLNFYHIYADIEPVEVHAEECAAIVRSIMLKEVIV